MHYYFYQLNVKFKILKTMEKIIFDGLLEDLSKKEMKNVMGAQCYCPGGDGGCGFYGGGTLSWFTCVCSVPTPGAPLVSWATRTVVLQAPDIIAAAKKADKECHIFMNTSCTPGAPWG